MSSMRNYLDMIIKELVRRPHTALVGRDPEAKMFRVDGLDSHKNTRVVTLPDPEHAIMKV